MAICSRLLLSVFSAVVLLALPCVSASKWSLCAAVNYPVTIKDVLINPEPIVAGQDVTFTIPAYSNDELPGGSAVVTVLYYGIKVYTEKDDLCSKAACPIDGDFTLNNSEALPAFTPPGKYTLRFQVLDSSGKELSCVSVSFSIVWGTELKEIVSEAKVELHRKIGEQF